MEAHTFAGLDLGGAVSGKSIVSILHEDSGKTRLVKMDVLKRADGALLTLLSKSGSTNTVLAIDAPLTLPACLAQPDRCGASAGCSIDVCLRSRRRQVSGRRGTRNGLPYLERSCELELRTDRWRQYGITPKSAMRLGQITAYGIYLQRQLIREGFPRENIIEVYPAANWKITDGKAIRETISKARKGSKEACRRLGSSLRRWMEADLEDLTRYGLDGLDAAMCALTGYWHVRGLTERVGDDDGWIVVPKPLNRKQTTYIR